MADVVKIAKKCHAELTAEIARLDEFLRMAEKLLKYDQKGSNKALEADRDDADGITVLTAASASPEADGAGAKA